MKHIYRAISRDGYNRLRYGPDAPRYAERIWVKPSSCIFYLSPAAIVRALGVRVRQGSAFVASQGLPTDELVPIESHPKIAYCLAHWRDGKPWEAAGAYDFMLEMISRKGRYDGCVDIDDVRERLDRLDEIYRETRAKGRFLCRKEVDKNNFRELNAPVFHVGPAGEVIFSGAGAHRFAIAIALDIELPAQIGCVDQLGLGFLPGLRRYHEADSIAA